MSEWKTMGWSPNIAPGERYGGAKPSRVVATMKRDLVDARRIHYWEGAASLSQMAVDGIGKPDQSRVTVTVPSMTVHWLKASELAWQLADLEAR